MNNANPLAKKYYPLPDLAKRWNLAATELLNYAIEGVIQVAIEEFRWANAGGVCTTEFHEWETDDYPSWVIFVVPDVLKNISAHGEASISGGMRIGSWGIQHVFFPERRLTVNDLIVLPQFISGISMNTDLQEEGQFLSLASRKTLLKQIAALAVLLSKENKSLAWGNRPNSLRIADSISQALAQWPTEKWGKLETDFFSKSKINDSIREGLDLIGFKEGEPSS